MKDYNGFFRKATEEAEPKATLEKDKVNKQIENARDIINKYRANYNDINPEVLSKLMSLKSITSSPKKTTPNKAAKEIEDLLGPAEVGETLRQERWPKKVRCPHCKSTNVNRLPPSQQKSKHNYKYHCNECEQNFNDDTDTPMEKGVPPLHTWMYCWYLLGISTSIQYIAQKLGLELAMVEFMISQMQKLFKAEKPLQHFMTFEEWVLKHGKNYKAIMRDSLERKQELLTGDNPDAPKDTREYDRVRQRRRDPNDPTPNKPKIKF